MKVSFDFDATLSRKDVQQFAKTLVSEGHEVWIVTSRFDDETANQMNWYWIKGQNKTLFDVADDCGIKHHNIKYTCAEPKSIFLKGRDFSFHLDDDDIEIMDILETGDNCVPVNVNQSNWEELCKKIINN